MSGKDNGFSDLPGGDRTVFRPNPGGARPVVVPAQPAAPVAGAPSPGAPRPGGNPSGRPDDWYALQGRAGPAEALPLAADIKMDELVSPNSNPIIRAGGPILLLLGGLRVASLRASPDSLMEQVAKAIEFFEKDIRSAGIPAEQVRSAQYVLCATADDIVQNIPTDDRQAWARYSMLYRFFKNRDGGVLFFKELDSAIADPTANYALLELMHGCLALGFQGKYRVIANGLAELPQIQRRLYETLRRVRPKATLELSPRWRGQAFGQRSWGTIVPVWVVATVVGVLLLGTFVTLRTRLGVRAGESEVALLALHPTTPIAIQRRQPAPPPPPPPRIAQMQRVGAKLPPGLCLADRKVAIAIRTCGLSLFASGSDAILPKYIPLVNSLADVINREAALNPQPAPLWIVGHTDRTKPGKTDRFASNAELSKARADAVATLVKPLLTDASRVRTDGKADTDPIDPRDTPAAYAVNRRVEILIPRND